MHFYTNPNFLLALWRDLANLNHKQVKLLKNVLFVEVIWERNIWPLRNQYIFTWQNGQMYVHMTSSKVVCTCHHIRKFLHRSLVLKIHLSPCHKTGTTAKGRNKNMASSEGAPLYLWSLIFLEVWSKPIMEDEHKKYFSKVREGGDYSNWFY